MDEIKTEISEPINAEVSEHSQPSADSNEFVEEGDNLSSTLEDTSGDTQIIQIICLSSHDFLWVSYCR